MRIKHKQKFTLRKNVANTEIRKEARDLNIAEAVTECLLLPINNNTFTEEGVFHVMISVVVSFIDYRINYVTVSSTNIKIRIGKSTARIYQLETNSLFLLSYYFTMI